MNKNSNQFITMTIGIVVAVIVASVVLIPIVNGMTDPIKTYTNEGVPFAVPDDGEHTIRIEADDNGKTVVLTDGEVVDGFEYLYNSSVSLVYAENNVVRLYSNGNVQILGSTSQSGSRPIVGNALNNPVTVTINGSTASFKGDNADTVWTLSSDVLAYPTADEDAEYRQGTEHKYAEDSNLIIAGGYSTNSSYGDFAMIFTGTPDNLTGSVVWGYTTQDIVISEIDVQTSNVCTNLYNVDKIDIALTSPTQGDATAIYTQFLITATGEYENPNYVGDTTATILAVIPIFVILAILMGVVGMFLNRRENL